MIDEKAFSKLSTPVKELQSECSTEILNVIMRRIKKIKDEPSQSDLAQYDDDLLEINKIKEEYESKTHKAIESSLIVIANMAYNDCDDLYGFARKYRPPLNKNDRLWDMTNEMITAVLLIYYGLNNDYYVRISDIKNPSIKRNIPLVTAYGQIVDKAQNAIKSNLDFDTVMLDVERDLIDNSIRIYNEGTNIDAVGGYYKADTGYEAILNQALVETAQRVYDTVAKDLRCDGIEISAHLAPAPDHAPCQGHQFTNQNCEYIQSGLDFVDIQGRHYIGFRRQIGTCNCRHVTKPIIIGKSEQTFTDYDLERILKANERGYNTKDGKHYTFYECTQKLNAFRRQMERAERGIKLAESAGNMQLKAKYESSYAHYKTLYNTFKKQLDTRLYANN